MPNLYAVIGVDRTASTKEITKAFRRKSVKTHPDKFMGDDSHAQKVIEFQELTEAYNELKDPELRKQYDRTGKTGARPFLPFPLCHEPCAVMERFLVFFGTRFDSSFLGVQPYHSYLHYCTVLEVIK